MVKFLAGAQNVSVLWNVQTSCGAQVASSSVYWGSFLEVKQPGHEANHSPLCSLECWSCSFILCLGLHGKVRHSSPFAYNMIYIYMSWRMCVDWSLVKFGRTFLTGDGMFVTGLSTKWLWISMALQVWSIVVTLCLPKLHASKILVKESLSCLKAG